MVFLLLTPYHRPRGASFPQSKTSAIQNSQTRDGNGSFSERNHQHADTLTGLDSSRIPTESPVHAKGIQSCLEMTTSSCRNPHETLYCIGFKNSWGVMVHFRQNKIIHLCRMIYSLAKNQANDPSSLFLDLRSRMIMPHPTRFGFGWRCLQWTTPSMPGQ